MRDCRRMVRCASLLAGLLLLLAPVPAWADVAGGPGFVMLTLGVLFVGAIVILLALIALFVIIRFLRAKGKDEDARAQAQGRPVPPRQDRDLP